MNLGEDKSTFFPKKWVNYEFSSESVTASVFCYQFKYLLLTVQMQSFVQCRVTRCMCVCVCVCVRERERERVTSQWSQQS